MRRAAAAIRTVTTCPAVTSSGNLLPPKSRTVVASVKAPPMNTRGPMTRLRESENAPGNFASDLVEQSSLPPLNRVAETMARLASDAIRGRSGPDEDGCRGAQEAATAAAASAGAAARILIG